MKRLRDCDDVCAVLVERGLFQRTFCGGNSEVDVRDGLCLLQSSGSIRMEGSYLSELLRAAVHRHDTFEYLRQVLGCLARSGRDVYCQFSLAAVVF